MMSESGPNAALAGSASLPVRLPARLHGNGDQSSPDDNRRKVRQRALKWLAAAEDMAENEDVRGISRPPAHHFASAPSIRSIPATPPPSPPAATLQPPLQPTASADWMYGCLTLSPSSNQGPTASFSNMELSEAEFAAAAMVQVPKTHTSPRLSLTPHAHTNEAHTHATHMQASVHPTYTSIQICQKPTSQMRAGHLVLN